MALQGKSETEIEVTAPADMFYSIFKGQIQHLPDIATTNIQGVQHEGGDWETHGHGSIKVWNYTAGDEVGVFKEKVEFNDEKKSMTLNGIEGNPFERYKSLKFTYHFTQKDQVTIANLSIEYEKLNADVANPDHYMDLMINIVKDLDAHIAQDLDD